MRFTLTIFISALFYFGANAQTVFWTEDFEATPCNSGCDPSIIGWTTTNTGTNSASPNVWYRSCAENGQAANVCGAGCGSDESLHIGSTTLGDLGAAYDASQTTNKRIESPTINCTGYNGITLDFNYITYGEPGFDFATLMYNDGGGWTTLANPIPVTSCCSGGIGGAACSGFAQGYWTAYTIALPASANNNSTVQIGFNWTNDASSGSDPSFAVDDITLSYASTLPIELASFVGNSTESGNQLVWSTLSEVNNDYFTIERSEDAFNFEPIGTMSGAGNSQSLMNYQFFDDNVHSTSYYYRLKQTDFNGEYSYSNTITLSRKVRGDFYYNNNIKSFEHSYDDAELLEIYSTSGQLVLKKSCQHQRHIPLQLEKGIYITKLYTSTTVVTGKIIVL